MSTTRIVVNAVAQTARIYAPYAMKDVIKQMPGRKWNADEKCWVLAIAFVPELADALRANESEVSIINSDGSPWNSKRPSDKRNTSPPAGWALAVLEAVGPSRMNRVHRALSRVLHPDIDGGSTILMAELNDARDRLTRRKP